MKRISYLYLSLVVGICSANAQQVIVTDDASYTTPASGAVLDIKSTDKGFMMPRIDLDSLKDIISVPNRTTGLMVYNTGTPTLPEKGIYIWNDSVWVKSLTAGSSPTNYLKIGDDGTVTLVGKATTFTDLVVPPYAARNSSSTTPPWSTFLSGTIGFETFGFADGTTNVDKQLFFNIQLPHDYKIGSDLHPHVHWSAQSAPGLNRVTWKLECQWVNHMGTFSTSPTNTTTLTGYELAGDPVVNNIVNRRSMAAYEHVITPLGILGGAGKNLSSMLICRLTRLTTDVNDNFVDPAFIISFDMHYEIDSFGSSLEYIK